MKTKKIIKLLLIMGVIVTILIAALSSKAMPLKATDTEASFYGVRLREGGAESSGTLSGEQSALYDTSRYKYDVGGNETYKIVEKNDGSNYSNAIYSLNAMGNIALSSTSSYDYSNYGNMFDVDLDEIEDLTDFNSLYLNINYVDDPDYWITNYNILLWLFNNLYIEKQSPEAKDAFIKNFKDYIEENKEFDDDYIEYSTYSDYTCDEIKSLLTDDYIDLIQQYVIWYFTNSYDENGDVNELYNFECLEFPEIELNDINDEPVIRTDSIEKQGLANILFHYLVDKADWSMGYETRYPNIVNQISGTSSLEGNYYRTGPFNVSLTKEDDEIINLASQNEYNILLVDQNGDEIDRDDYIIKINNVEVDLNVDEILNEEFYVSIPKTHTNNTEITLELTHREYETEATLRK